MQVTALDPEIGLWENYLGEPGYNFGLSGVSISFTDLNGAALGQTTGSAITLDWNGVNRGQTTIFC